MAITNVVVSTVKAGRDYRARATDANDRLIASYRLMLAGGIVQVYTADYAVGGYRLDRFGGALSPQSVRRFFLSKGEGK